MSTDLLIFEHPLVLPFYLLQCRSQWYLSPFVLYPQCVLTHSYADNRSDTSTDYNNQIKRLFHGVMVRIGKAETEGWPVRSGPSFSDVQITGLPEGSTFPILTNDPVIDYFSCLSTLIDHLTTQLNVFYTFTYNDVMLLFSVATLRR